MMGMFLDDAPKAELLAALDAPRAPTSPRARARSSASASAPGARRGPAKRAARPPPRIWMPERVANSGPREIRHAGRVKGKTRPGLCHR